MSRFLDRFPKISYDITKNKYSNFENVTDLTFRFSVIKEVLDNTAAYYEYAIREGETPEILADRVYGDPEAYWLILYANNIYDPQYDWPMNTDTFQKFIVGKYGSIEAAQSGIHHYEKIVARQIGGSETVYMDKTPVDFNVQTELVCTLDTTSANATSIFGGEVVVQTNQSTGQFTFNAYVVNYDPVNKRAQLQINYGKLQNYVDLFAPSVSQVLGLVTDNTQKDLDTFQTLPEEPQLTSYILNNKTVLEGVSRRTVSFYDHELELNESKRLIKIIKKEYFGQIQNEFGLLTKTAPGFFRRLS
jgi:hypothetical protein